MEEITSLHWPIIRLLGRIYIKRLKRRHFYPNETSIRAAYHSAVMSYGASQCNSHTRNTLADYQTKMSPLEFDDQFMNSQLGPRGRKVDHHLPGREISKRHQLCTVQLAQTIAGTP
jgi:hypothetical protein